MAAAAPTTRIPLGENEPHSPGCDLGRCKTTSPAASSTEQCAKRYSTRACRSTARRYGRQLILTNSGEQSTSSRRRDSPPARISTATVTAAAVSLKRTTGRTGMPAGGVTPQALPPSARPSQLSSTAASGGMDQAGSEVQREASSGLLY